MNKINFDILHVTLPLLNHRPICSYFLGGCYYQYAHCLFNMHNLSHPLISENHNGIWTTPITMPTTGADLQVNDFLFITPSYIF